MSDTKLHFLVIVIAAGLILFSGTKLAIYADWIAHRFKIGRVFIGAFLLAIVTSLPELATTITASWIGNAQLAINNLLGGINLQTVIIAFADLFFIKGALTFFSPKSGLLTGGVFVIIQLSIALLGLNVGEYISLANIGLWPILLFSNYLLMLYFLAFNTNEERWVAKGASQKELMRYKPPKKMQFSNLRLFSAFAIHACIVLLAGWSIAFFSDQLAVDLQWSGSWIGATLVAFTTSLPEISTTFGAVRQKAYVLAIANIFGSNVLTISLLFFADLFYKKGPIMNEIEPSNTLLIAIGIIITGIYLWGILERKNKTIVRMGYDSFIVLMTYILSLYLLYIRS